MRTRRTVPVLLLALVLGVVACGDDDGDDAATDTSSTTTTEAAPTSDAAPTTDGDAATTTTGGEGSTTTDGGTSTPGGPVPDDELPGEPIDIYPYEGASLAVVGVAADDTLNVRAGPGTSFDVVVELGPLATGFAATGRNRTLDDSSFWSEVDVDGQVGWANVGFLAQLAAPRDITDEVRVSPEGSSPADIAEDVAGQLAPGGEGPTPAITVVQSGQTEGIADVIGLADDAQKGERVRVTVADGTVSVEATALCARGVSDGLCT